MKLGRAAITRSIEIIKGQLLSNYSRIARSYRPKCGTTVKFDLLCTDSTACCHFDCPDYVRSSTAACHFGRSEARWSCLAGVCPHAMQIPPLRTWSLTCVKSKESFDRDDSRTG